MSWSWLRPQLKTENRFRKKPFITFYVLLFFYMVHLLWNSYTILSLVSRCSKSVWHKCEFNTLKFRKNEKKGWEIFQKIIGFDAAATKDKNTLNTTHKGDSLSLFTQIMCCTCPSRGFVRTAVVYAQHEPTHTQTYMKFIYYEPCARAHAFLFPYRQYFEMKKKIVYNFCSAYILRLLPWTATDCILKCLPVGSESREKKLR